VAIVIDTVCGQSYQ